MNVSEKIFYAKFGLDGAARLSNPFIKLTLLLLPIAVFIFQIVARLSDRPRLTEAELIILAFVLYISSNLALSGSKRSTFVYRAVRFGALCAVLFLAHSGPSGFLKGAAEVISHTFSRIHALTSIAFETWLIILFIFPIMAAARNITTRDALWIGRSFLWGWFFIAYIVFIVVHAVLGSVLPVRLTSAWDAAVSKGKLSKNSCIDDSGGYFSRAKNISVTFARNMVANNAALSVSVVTLLKQRGMFSRSSIDHHLRNYSAEDVVTILLLTGFVFFDVLFRVFPRVVIH